MKESIQDAMEAFISYVRAIGITHQCKAVKQDNFTPIAGRVDQWDLVWDTPVAGKPPTKTNLNLLADMTTGQIYDGAMTSAAAELFEYYGMGALPMTFHQYQHPELRSKPGPGPEKPDGGPVGAAVPGRPGFFALGSNWEPGTEIKLPDGRRFIVVSETPFQRALKQL